MTEVTEGMVGGGYYDNHSTFQGDVAGSAAKLLERAVATLALPVNVGATVADYGCSEGRNSMALIGTALALLRARSAVPVVVLHNDVPRNDWKGLAENLSSPESYLRKFPQVRALFAPHSFFERVTLPASVTLGISSSAAHWLSQQPPDLNMPTTLYRSDAPPAELTKILKQAALDWEAFLTARAEELQPGGVLLAIMLGSDASVDPVRVSAAGPLKLMNDCALQLIHAGEISQDVYARYCFPVVPRTIEEAAAPISGPLSDRLELLHCGLAAVPSPYQLELERTGDVEAFAENYTGFIRAFSENSLREALFQFGTGRADFLADRFFAIMRTALTTHPNDYRFDDLTLTVMVRRRNKD
jgi:S-adenosylmethionine-dependent carboxyl methyltransferase